MSRGAIYSLLRFALAGLPMVSAAACIVAPAAREKDTSVAAGLAVVSGPGPEQDAAREAELGERLFGERCASCHEAGRAPARSQIAKNSPQQILEALDTGFMAPVAMFMSAREKDILARYLSNAPDQ